MKKTVQRTLIFLLFTLIGAAIFVALIARIGVGEILDTMALFGILPFVFFVLISLTNFSLYTYRWMHIVNRDLPKENRISFHRLYLHRMSGYAVSYLTPMAQVGGEPMRIGLLSDDGISVKRATSSVVIDLAFEITAFILFVSAGLVLALTEGVALGNTGVLLATTIGLVIFILGAFYWATVNGRGFFRSIFRFFRLHKHKRLKRMDSWLQETEALMTEFMAKSPLFLVWLLFLSIVMVSFKALEVWFIAHFLGVSFTFAQAFLTSTIPGLAMLIPVPGGLGFFEGSTTGLFAVLGISLNAVALVMIIRLRDVVFVTIGLTHGSKRITAYLKRRIEKQKITEKITDKIEQVKEVLD